MLIITRKERESITVSLPDGREMKIVVTVIKGKQVRIGFNAPANVIVHRHDEEQFLEQNLLKLKRDNRIKCDDLVFIDTWMNTHIPELHTTAREAVRNEPKRVSQVWLILKKEFQNALPKF